MKADTLKRVLASGALWALVYDLTWGLAWFAFMRRQWLAATAGAGHALPWNVIWIVWVALTLPLGLAAMAFVANRARPVPAAQSALAVAVTLWVPLTAGGVGWGWSQSLPPGILGLDATVNLCCLVLASLAGERTLRIRHP